MVSPKEASIMSRRALIILLFAIMANIFPGCSEDGGQIGIVRRPGIRQTSPQDEATDTNLNPLIQVWFDDALDEATIDSAAFHVVGARTYRLEYVGSDSSIVLYLAEMLEPESTYSVRVTRDIENSGGNGMLGDYTFSFTTGALDCDHLEDYLEPSNDMDTAPMLELDKTYTLLSSCGAGDDEFYKFTLDEAAMVTLRIDHSYSELDRTGWDLRFRVCGSMFYRPLWAQLQKGQTLNLRYSFLPGTYCVETGNTEEETSIAVYDLTLETSTPCSDDAHEDNDFMWDAKYVTEGTHSFRGCMWDRDYYKVSLDSGQTLTVTLGQDPPGNAQRILSITDFNNFTLADSMGFTDPLSLSWTADEDTTYHIKAMWYNDGITYDLGIDISE
jgi:hypothetical protein